MKHDFKSLFRKAFERWEYEKLPIIYKGKCRNIPNRTWGKIRKIARDEK